MTKSSSIMITILSILLIINACSNIYHIIESSKTKEKYQQIQEEYKFAQAEWDVLSGNYENTVQQNNNTIAELKKKNNKLSKQLKEKDAEIKSLKQKVNTSGVTKKKSNGTTLSLDSGFRSWMPSSALSRSSAQWRVVKQGSPNEYGILEIDNRAVVAVGTGWGLNLGDKATVNTTNGSYKIIVGDWKANGDTDSSNKVTLSNGCVVEFIVDRGSLSSKIRSSGNVASISKYSGKITSITKD